MFGYCVSVALGLCTGQEVAQSIRDCIRPVVEAEAVTTHPAMLLQGEPYRLAEATAVAFGVVYDHGGHEATVVMADRLSEHSSEVLRTAGMCYNSLR